MSKPKRMTIANRLHKAIKASPLTVNAIAVETGIPQPVLHRFIHGEQDITLTTAEKLARYFNLELK